MGQELGEGGASKPRPAKGPWYDNNQAIIAEPVIDPLESLVSHIREALERSKKGPTPGPATLPTAAPT
jgi:hypothetical protein